MIRKITSKDNNRVKYAASLLNTKYRKENHQFLAEGFKSLELAIKAGVVSEVFTNEPLKIDEKIVQNLVHMDVIRKISTSQNPEGIVFICNEVKRALPKKAKKIIYLDHVSDPGNMGTIIRTALAFDYDAVVVSEGCCSVYNEKVVAATKGALFLIPIVEASIDDLKADRKIIVSTLDSESQELNKVEKPENFVLVVGNESHGVSKETLDLADVKVKIAIKNIDSLNVGVASGILLHYFA